MAKIKLTKTTVDAATYGAKEYELRDTVVPGFLLKVTPAGRKIFMVQYRTNAGERRKPAIGRFGELTVEQARSIAQDWLADMRKGKDPSAEKTAARDTPSVKDLCTKFIEDYSKPKYRPRTVESNQGYIDRHIIPGLGTLKVRAVSRSDVSSLVGRYVGGERAMLGSQFQPLSLSRLVRSRPIAANVAGEQFAVFRGDDGRATALVDRCPHRGMQLSRGRVANGVLSHSLRSRARRGTDRGALCARSWRAADPCKPLRRCSRRTASASRRGGTVG